MEKLNGRKDLVLGYLSKQTVTCSELVNGVVLAFLLLNENISHTFFQLLTLNRQMFAGLRYMLRSGISCAMS